MVHLDDPRVRRSEVPSGEHDAVPALPDERALPASAALQPDSAGLLPTRLLALVVGAVLVLAVVLRFTTRSPLWLDEALTVNISSRPLSQLPHLLSHDGAPPLYYFLLHFWMKAFGTSDLATRALAGLCGVVNLPVGWLAAYRVGSRWWALEEMDPFEARALMTRGRIAGWAATLLLASSPFAVYYDTEARMYGLVLLLGTLAVLAVTSLLRRPGLSRALLVFLVAAALLYSHYWALYLWGVAGLGSLWFAWRGPRKEAARYMVAALTAAGIAFLPWFPTFWFQLHHTGTPWAAPADYTAIVFTFTQFAGGNSDAGRALALVLFALALLALFGAPLRARLVLLDLRTRPGVRLVTAAVIATLVVAILAGKISGSTFADRYTSVVAFPAILVFGYGAATIGDARIRQGVLAVAVLFGFAASVPNAMILRTQAGEVAAALNARARRGDVVGYCPDQLGPSVSRLTKAGLPQITFPRDSAPQIVDWVNYKSVIARASPWRFAKLLERRAAGRTIYLVLAPGYQGFGNDCQDIALDLGRNRHQSTVVAAQPSDTPFEIYEGMTLLRFSPR